MDNMMHALCRYNTSRIYNFSLLELFNSIVYLSFDLQKIL